MARFPIPFLIAFIALGDFSNASVVTIAGLRSGPFVFESNNRISVNEGLVRIGTLTGDPVSAHPFDIDQVFREFATGSTASNGRLGQTVAQCCTSEFDGEQIYIWIYSGDRNTFPAEIALITLTDPENPSAGGPWFFPEHTGTGADGTTIALSALFETGAAELTVTPDVRFETTQEGSRIILHPIPEPSGSLLFFSGLLVLLSTRRR